LNDEGSVKILAFLTSDSLGPLEPGRAGAEALRGACASAGIRTVITSRKFVEAMRLYPPVGMLARNVRGADILGGRQILPNDLLFLPIYALHRHHMWWERPNQFDPGRFSSEAVRSRDRYLYLPFGAGPRVCVGANFAMMQAHIILATLVARFQFDPAGGSLPMPTMSMTVRPDTGVRLAVKSV
jgi:cytochrome P450